MIARRALLKAGLVSGMAATLGGHFLFAQQRAWGAGAAQVGPGPMGGGMMGDGLGGAATVTSALRVPPFQTSLPLPDVLAPTRSDETTDYYELTMREARLDIVPDHPTTIWGFNGQYPGPTLRAKRARRAVVRQTNGLSEPTVTHLHGGHVAPEMDGHPTDYIQPGAAKDYEYPNTQLAATLWYHDHTMNVTGPHVYMGLAGFYLLEDDDETGLNLPAGDYDVPLCIQDRAFAADGSFRYPQGGMMGGMMGMMQGVLGDTILVNGAVQPFFPVAARKYRFRLLNASNARHYELALGSGQPLVVIAGDGGLLPAPVTVPSVSIAPAERYEVVLDFSDYPVGTQLVLQNRLGIGSTVSVMRFDVVRQEADDSALPAVLRPLERLAAQEATQTRDFTLDMGMMGSMMGPGGMMGGGNRSGGMGMMGRGGMMGGGRQPGGMGGMMGGMWRINGQAYDAQRIDARPRLGSTEIWRFRNPTTMAHPVHLHAGMFQVLDRNGAPPAPAEAGWKDTVHVGSGETVRLITRFTDYTGTYVFHCHNLEHEDGGMMSQFQIS